MAIWVKVLPEGGKVNEADIASLAEKVNEAVNFSRRIGEIKRDSESKELWGKVYAELSEGKAGLLGAVTARAEAQVMRLACLYALLDLSDTIRLEHLSAGLALWAYCEDSAKYIFGETLGDPLADEIKRVLDDEPKGLTQTELSNHFKRHKKSEQLNRALNILIARGMVFKVGEETAGRTSHRYFSSQNYRRNN